MSTSAITLPQDQYLHPTADNEWWWHIGTLTSGDRVFGFEINAAERIFFGTRVLFSQIMLTDVANQIHYETNTPFPYDPAWAESDPTKDWYVTLGKAGASGAVSMTAQASNVEAMTVEAAFVDPTTKTTISFGLELVQQGDPLLVWGTGVDPGTGPIDPTNRNFYYSFTRLQASGTVTIGSESFAVAGETWMDHEYGLFPQSTSWILQDAQLDNGVHLSCFAAGTPPVKDAAMAAKVTVLSPDGTSTFYTDGVTITPRGPQWTNPYGLKYCTVMDVDIPEIDAQLTFTASMPGQEFTSQTMPVYEGVATAKGKMAGADVSGPGWIEQALHPTSNGLAG